MQENKIYHSNFLDNKLKAKSAKTIIADPPYFEVKGGFDYIWASFAEYLKDVELWAVECKRILADNGTLFWYGDRKKIAYSQIILDKYFNLEENVTIHIFDRQTNKIPAEDATSFINVTEHLLMYSNGNDGNKCNMIHKDNFKTVFAKIQETCTKNDFTNCLLKLKIASNLNSAKVLASYKLGIHNTRFDFLTKEMYNEIGNFNYTYEALRQEYEALRRPFNIQEKYKTNVLRISQEGHKTGKYEHDTVKPELLSRILIDATTTDKNDLVVVPFSGSGTECAMAKKENRNYIGFDIDKKYVDMANNRCRNIGASLFS